MALPLKKQIKNIRNYLKVFEYAMRLKDIPPKVGVSQRNLVNKIKHFELANIAV